jgi:GWxTD domain-containing protein
MIAVRLTALAALTVLGRVGEIPNQPDVGLILRAVRSYRAEQGRTEVNAIIEVPLMALEPTAEGSEGTMSYRVAVRVTDSTGLTLLQQGWQNHVPGAVRRPEASAVEVVRFSLAPGRYRLEVSVEDSVSGRQVASTAELEGFSAAPPASDLLLSPQIRAATAEDTAPRPAELRWGRMLVTAAARLELTPLRPTAFYLFEAYSTTEEVGSLSIRVADSTGKPLMTTAATQVRIPTGGGVLKGQVDLNGLPPGSYTMTAALRVGGNTVERSAGFLMAPLDETLQKDVSRREAARVTDEGYFDALDQAGLEAAEEPLGLIAASGELSKYSNDLSLRAKRRFLTEFWQRRDQTPGTPANEARELFYETVAYANKTYGEKGHAGMSGWKSDRGRIYIRNGAPDETLERPSEGRSPPYEVWSYRRGKQLYYVFADRSNGLGIYQLIYSNDLKETGAPDWQEILHKEDAVIDIGRFLGIEIRTNRGDR